MHSSGENVYGLETTTLTRQSADHLKVAQRAMERAMLGISFRDRLKNQEIRRTRVTDVIARVAECGSSSSGLYFGDPEKPQSHKGDG